MGMFNGKASDIQYKLVPGNGINITGDHSEGISVNEATIKTISEGVCAKNGIITDCYAVRKAGVYAVPSTASNMPVAIDPDRLATLIVSDGVSAGKTASWELTFIPPRPATEIYQNEITAAGTVPNTWSKLVNGDKIAKIKIDGAGTAALFNDGNYYYVPTVAQNTVLPDGNLVIGNGNKAVKDSGFKINDIKNRSYFGYTTADPGAGTKIITVTGYTGAPYDGMVINVIFINGNVNTGSLLFMVNGYDNAVYGTNNLITAGQTIPFIFNAGDNIWQPVDGVNAGKADKVTGATSGRLAGLNASGNLTDSGVNAADMVLPATNLVTNGDFSNGTTGWSTGSTATITVANNIATLVGNGSDKNIYLQQSIGTAFIVGHKYYLGIEVSVTDTAMPQISVYSYDIGVGNGTIDKATANISYKLSCVVTKTSTYTYFLTRVQYADAATANGKIVTAKFAKMLDLTAAFGAGNEPTSAQMDSLLSYYPNSWFNGTVNLAANAKMVPYLLQQIKNFATEKTGYGVYSGLSVTAQSTPDMTVSVSAGIIYMDTGTRFTPSAVSSLAMSVADATNPRIDIVYVSSSGVISYLAGTPAASPVVPSVPTGGQKIAEINVAAGVTAITNAVITDKRRLNLQGEWITPTLLNGWVSNGGANAVQYIKDANGFVHFRGQAISGTSGSTIFVLPAGYRPNRYGYYPVPNNAVLVDSGWIIQSGAVKPANAGTSIYLDGITFRAEA